MGRLTMRLESGVSVFKDTSNLYRFCGKCKNENCNDCSFGQILNKLATIEDICDDPEQIRQAIERGKARKVVLKKSTNLSFRSCDIHCPCCDARFGAAVKTTHGSFCNTRPYCDMCGQKLDWSE